VALRGEGFSRWRAFAIASLTGLVEPIGGVLGLGAVTIAEPVLPCSMVISHEIIPETHRRGFQKHAVSRRDAQLIFSVFASATDSCEAGTPSAHAHPTGFEPVISAEGAFAPAATRPAPANESDNRTGGPDQRSTADLCEDQRVQESRVWRRSRTIAEPCRCASMRCR
jgi:hypothetical protein